MEHIRETFLAVFKTSAFNTCTTQKLPMMDGEPMKICINNTKFERPVNIPNPYTVEKQCTSNSKPTYRWEL